MNDSLNQTLNDSTAINPNIRYGLLSIKIIMIFSTVIMNFTILNAILFKVKNKKYSYYLFLSIATGDLIVGTSSMSFMTIFTMFNYWPLGYSSCVFWVIVDYSTSTINLINIMLLTIQRYLLIKYPYSTKEKLTKLKIMLILSVWLICYSYWATSVLIITSVPDFDPLNCYFTYTFSYVLTSDLAAYGTPVVLITIFSILTMIELKKNRKSLTNNNSQTNKLKAKKSERAFLCILLVSTNIIAFWMVFIVCWPINAYCNGCLDVVLMEVSYWLAYLASTTNPIIVLTFNKTIRRKAFSIIRMLFCIKRRNAIINASISAITGTGQTIPNQFKTESYS